MFHVKRFGTIGGRKSYRASYIARLVAGGIALINRPMGHRDHDRKLGGNPDLFASDFCTKKAYLNQGSGSGA